LSRCGKFFTRRMRSSRSGLRGAALFT
jgi:hypothetical protein